jgi:hypothetical protein
MFDRNPYLIGLIFVMVVVAAIYAQAWWKVRKFKTGRRF